VGDDLAAGDLISEAVPPGITTTIDIIAVHQPDPAPPVQRFLDRVTPDGLSVTP
jgi:hypothetical protein